MKKKILVVDDETELRKLITKLLTIEGYLVSEAESAERALELLQKEEFPVILSDLKMPGMSGLDLLSKVKSMDHSIEVILLTAYGNIEDGVESIKRGAFDYITKGDEDNKILPVIEKAFEKIELKKKIDHLERKIGMVNSFDSLTGSSSAICRIREVAKKVASTDVPVLITGETGTGKEILAQAIHNGSNRSQALLLTINCSAIPKDLIESELFGYKAGAFTGATKNKKGLFEEAHTGTLFLDEVGELEPLAQAKLLRVIETKSFIKTGDTVVTNVDVRIIAATNKNLEEEILKGNFRADLYYRLSVFSINIPPLRERKEDIRELALEIISSLCFKMNLPKVEVEEKFLSQLEKYSFPGNIRELRNVIERSLILSTNGKLSETHLPLEFFIESCIDAGEENLDLVEKKHILNVLKKFHNNKTHAASALGIGIATLYRKLEKYGISSETD